MRNKARCSPMDTAGYNRTPAFRKTTLGSLLFRQLQHSHAGLRIAQVP
jgi:hypothetical protein